MRPISSSGTSRRAWQTPAVKKLAIGTQSRSNTAGSAEVSPQAPTPPGTKLGFSFEMSIPLSARTEQ